MPVPYISKCLCRVPLIPLDQNILHLFIRFTFPFSILPSTILSPCITLPCKHTVAHYKIVLIWQLPPHEDLDSSMTSLQGLKSRTMAIIVKMYHFDKLVKLDTIQHRHYLLCCYINEYLYMLIVDTPRHARIQDELRYSCYLTR